MEQIGEDSVVSEQDAGEAGEGESDSEVESESEEEDGDCEEEEEEDGSDDDDESYEEEEPATKKLKRQVNPPEDYMSHAFYERGLYAIASIIAFKVRNKLPDFKDSNKKLPTKCPTWIEHYSARGMCPPTTQLVDFVKVMDRNFHNIHGETILKEKGLVKTFTSLIQITAPQIPCQIVSVFAKLRILIRVRALNKRNKDQKKEDALHDKLDKNSRQAQVNKVWESCKM